ncbi:hypothetical protein RDI58_030608 [Solanum bulbocastanum]|uniref:Uncharacterized protein n=2 Tax=Solanoideae TaxID=424551 RepID=A0AAN8SSN4_SOLBU
MKIKTSSGFKNLL